MDTVESDDEAASFTERQLHQFAPWQRAIRHLRGVAFAGLPYQPSEFCKLYLELLPLAPELRVHLRLRATGGGVGAALHVATEPDRDGHCGGVWPGVGAAASLLTARESESEACAALAEGEGGGVQCPAGQRIRAVRFASWGTPSTLDLPSARATRR